MKTIPVSLAILTLAGATQAQPAPPPSEEREVPKKRPMAEIWKRADQDGNGSLSFPEFSSLPRLQVLEEEKRKHLFKRLDKDSNEQIEPEEMHHLKGQDDGNGPKHPMRRLWELDTDKDGAISREEFQKGHLSRKLPPDRQSRLFERLDTNGDGRITQDDKPQAPGPMGKGPGGEKPGHPGPRFPRPDHGSGEGFHAPVPRASQFPRFDSNKDGSLDFSEFSEVPFLENLGEDVREDRFERMDKDKNLKITQDEMMADPEQTSAQDMPRRNGHPKGQAPVSGAVD